MKRIQWLARRQLARLGRQGIAGLALAVVAGLIFVAGVIPQKTKLAELRAQAQSARDFAREQGVSGDAQRVRTQLERFYTLLPERSSAPDWLDKIYAAARAQSVRLERGEYKLTPARNGRMAGYEISLPVRGNYVQVRAFVSQVLDDVPAAALDEIALKRDDRGKPEVEASLRFTLFLGEG